jgi:hypothetical protein
LENITVVKNASQRIILDAAGMVKILLGRTVTFSAN